MAGGLAQFVPPSPGANRVNDKGSKWLDLGPIKMKMCDFSVMKVQVWIMEGWRPYMRCSIDKCQRSNWRLTIWSVPSSSDHFKDILSYVYLKGDHPKQASTMTHVISGVQLYKGTVTMTISFFCCNFPNIERAQRNRDECKCFDVILKHDKDKCVWKEVGRRKSCPICSYALLNILK